MKLTEFIKKGGFIVLMLFAAVIADCCLARSGWIRSSGYFWLNDYEIVQKAHPEKQWSNVIFGSSELTSGFREELSKTDYINLGMDYGVITDLEIMLKDGSLPVTDNLVIALNWGVLCDELDTNPTYIWHRKWYEPYVYFQRSRISSFLKTEWGALIGANEPAEKISLNQGKELYYGVMSDENMLARQGRLDSMFFYRGVDGFSENLEALDRVLKLCREKGLNVRTVWLPENPAYPLGEVNDSVKAEALSICESNGIECFDMTKLLEQECFYDTGHINDEQGAKLFTEAMDKWLTE